jgi:hypothetical protein
MRPYYQTPALRERVLRLAPRNRARVRAMARHEAAQGASTLDWKPELYFVGARHLRLCGFKAAPR